MRWRDPLCCILLPCSSSSQAQSYKAKWLWTETSETMSQNKPFLFKLTYLRYFVIATESFWLYVLWFHFNLLLGTSLLYILLLMEDKTSLSSLDSLTRLWNDHEQPWHQPDNCNFSTEYLKLPGYLKAVSEEWGLGP
jgi:hypothetical protein